MPPAGFETRAVTGIVIDLVAQIVEAEPVVANRKCMGETLFGFLLLRSVLRALLVSSMSI